MDRNELAQYIDDTFGIAGDHPFEQYPDYLVFRHNDSKKWFAVIMNLPKDKFIPNAVGKADAVNLKCDSLLIGSLLLEKGFYPAYHMNKSSWISVVLEECDDTDKLRMIVDMSFELTGKNQKRKKQ